MTLFAVPLLRLQLTSFRLRNFKLFTEFTETNVHFILVTLFFCIFVFWSSSMFVYFFTEYSQVSNRRGGLNKRIEFYPLVSINVRKMQCSAVKKQRARVLRDKVGFGVHSAVLSCWSFALQSTGYESRRHRSQIPCSNSGSKRV